MPQPPFPDFYPPRRHAWFVYLVQQIAALVGHWHYRFHLVTPPEGLERLRSLRHQRLLLLPNHPTFHDPAAIFVLSARLGFPCYYLSAHEPFRSSLGVWLQRLGGYSIRRGMADRASIAQTLELLTQPTCKLVIFAEGGCSFQNDTVMPFRSGAIQMAFQAMQRLVRQGQPLPDLYAVPISLKYRYTQDMTAVIDQSLIALEQALYLTAKGDFYERLRAVAAQILLVCEQNYGLANALDLENWDWDQRVARLKTYILEGCEHQLGLTATLGECDRDRTYRIQAALADWNPPHNVEVQWTPTAIAKAASRVLNFDAIYDGYVAANPTPERFLDTLIRFEREVFNIDQPRPKGQRQVCLHIAEPLNLKDWFPDYQQHRSRTITTLTDKIHQTVQHHLEQSLTQAEC
ncbi:hypothetical protein DO97_14690 [Neosynechococcus sphagnicola sy1]|uniref:Phospholipid/glycerol acyltransferase domain-containing protein n=1 Tax=Neosynechococcus sphagnicola sy1 TaxID=1497020 RepID=A0A098TIE2_9CYAN|nr:1-acyl-sn-glycerol-3-phosphate acyltransferase [Neosynechococcus sphagnicola]KGF71879.1 hypothetical protein DO97_14690 [Neosynechococcus sphagnicola sy1]